MDRSPTWILASAIIVLFAPAIIIIYDLLAIHFGGPEASLSAAIQRIARAYPELPALCAGLFVWLWAHLFLSGALDRAQKVAQEPPAKVAPDKRD
jgi:hypothetical protein